MLELLSYRKQYDYVVSQKYLYSARLTSTWLLFIIPNYKLDWLKSINI